jgi:hypothetical protein
MYADDNSVLSGLMSSDKHRSATTVYIGNVTEYFEGNNLYSNLLKSTFFSVLKKLSGF